MSGCTGKCCSVFNYTVTPDELRKRSEGREGYWADQDRFLADMLVELTPEEAVERSVRFGVQDPTPEIDLVKWATDYGPLYTCRHWDEETRLCTVYEDRPDMCRDYPYNRACQHDCDCSFRSPTHIRTKWAAIDVQGAVRRAAQPTT
jgi:Fe-S-cluster containining protein